jgi:hypothetical protein
MAEQPSFEDLIRAIIRRRVLVAVIVVVLTLLGAWYGKRTTSGGDYSAEATINIVDTNAITSEGLLLPTELKAPVEAARLTADLRTYAGELHESVTVKADVAGNSIIITAEGDTAAAAEELAISTGTSFVTARRQIDRNRFSEQAVFERQQLDQLEARLDQVNADLAGATEQSLALEGERIQLFDRLLRTGSRAAAVATNAEQFDSGLTEPVIVEPATPSASSGWIVFGIVGALLGALAGIGVALMLNSLDHRVRSRADVERITGGAPVLAVLGNEVDAAEMERLTSRVAARRSPSPMVFVTDAPSGGLSRALTGSLESTGEVIVRPTADAVYESQAVIGIQAGQASDAQLAALVADFANQGVEVLGIVMWGVRAGDIEWARRPLLTRA